LDVAYDGVAREIQAQITPSDIEVARTLVARDDGVMWGATLARRFREDAGLTESVLSAFDRSEVIEERIGLLHHVTVRTMAESDRSRLETWVRENLDAFVADQRIAFQAGFDGLHLRLESDDPGFRAKRWLYMYSALILPREEAVRLLSGYAAGEEPVAGSARAALDSLA
jgi:hypothetical protein